MLRLACQLAIVLPLTVAGQSVNFEKNVLPIFRGACGQCHMGDAAMGKLRLDAAPALLRGGASGPAILPGEAGESLLIKRILGTTDAPRMPLGKQPLTSDQIALIERWIDTADFSQIPSVVPADSGVLRSEEHTSELQS